MAGHRVCPWWLGYLLASPFRRVWYNPTAILGGHVRAGMTVFEPGPGMGFFTLELARLVGASGRVVAVDVQSKMLNALQRRLARAGLLERVDARLARPDSMGLNGLDGAVDFALVFAVVHELPSADAFFSETSQALKPGATLLLAEPSGHVTAPEFDAELACAARTGLAAVEYPSIRRSRSALLRKA
ncbi:MAG TPA: class I SAM-dependent methyltransferase [Bryobacteraceae bacterium]|nr:class I SAM-dependent methyltransferase [Bryobacteraceae bacterium]